MSRSPTGTSMDEDRLLELREGHEAADATYVVAAADLLERTALSADDLVDWSPDEEGGDPMLVFGPLAEAAIDDAAYPRRIYDLDGETYVPVPDELLEAPPPDGLGLDLETYDPDAPLLFEAVATDETVGLLPVRFADGRPYAQEPQPDVSERSDPVAEAELEREGRDPTPRPETVDAPIDPDLLEESVTATDADPGAVTAVLEELNRRELVGEGDIVSERPPLSVDDRAVCLLPGDAWEAELGPRLEEEDPDALEAAGEIHERQARRLVDEAGAEEYRGFDEEYAAVVTFERETAAWEVAGTGPDE